jgi:hypothetical protein
MIDKKNPSFDRAFNQTIMSHFCDFVTVPFCVCLYHLFCETVYLLSLSLASLIGTFPGVVNIN